MQYYSEIEFTAGGRPMLSCRAHSMRAYSRAFESLAAGNLTDATDCIRSAVYWADEAGNVEPATYAYMRTLHRWLTGYLPMGALVPFAHLTTEEAC